MKQSTIKPDGINKILAGMDWTDEQMAATFYVSTSCIQSWRTGRRNIPKTHEIHLQKYLDIVNEKERRRARING